MSTSIFVLQQLRSDYLQQQTRWFIAQACYHRQLKLFRVLINHHVCVTQGSSNLLGSHAHAETRSRIYSISDMLHWICAYRSGILIQAVINFNKRCEPCLCRSRWPCGLWRRSCPGCWDCWFEFRFGHWCLSHVSRRGLETSLALVWVQQCACRRIGVVP